MQDIFACLCQMHGRISTNALKANTKKMTQPIAPHLPVPIIFKQIEDCNRFQTAGGVPFTPAQILKAAEALILSAERCDISCHEWISLTEAQKTYDNFKTIFSR